HRSQVQLREQGLGPRPLHVPEAVGLELGTRIHHHEVGRVEQAADVVDADGDEAGSGPQRGKRGAAAADQDVLASVPLGEVLQACRGDGCLDHGVLRGGDQVNAFKAFTMARALPLACVRLLRSGVSSRLAMSPPDGDSVTARITVPAIPPPTPVTFCIAAEMTASVLLRARAACTAARI